MTQFNVTNNHFQLVTNRADDTFGDMLIILYPVVFLGLHKTDSIFNFLCLPFKIKIGLLNNETGILSRKKNVILRKLFSKFRNYFCVNRCFLYIFRHNYWSKFWNIIFSNFVVKDLYKSEKTFCGDYAII